MTGRSFRVLCPHCNRAAFTLSPDPEASILDDPIMTTDGRHWTRGVGDRPSAVHSRRAPIAELAAMPWWVVSTAGGKPNVIECAETGEAFGLHVEEIRRAWKSFRAGGSVRKVVGEPVQKGPFSRDW